MVLMRSTGLSSWSNTQAALETPAGVVSSSCAYVANGHRNLRRAHRDLSVVTLWRRRDSLACAFRERANVAASRLMLAGAIPARIGSWFTGVVRRHPEMVIRVLLRAASSFLTWELRHQTGAQHSAAESTRDWVEIRSVFVAAPQVVQTRRHIRATRAVVFALTLSRCCLNVSVLSSFTQMWEWTGTAAGLGLP